MQHARIFAALFAAASAAFAQPAAGPWGAVPHERQVAWQKLEYYGFVHFGLNTWTDREWGYGNEDPKLFNPSDFDARAIAKICKDAGMKGLILTAKHHDGFCLWPTKTTEHNITKSPWKNGKGDLIADFAAACKAEGIKLGIYVSPWDRNTPHYAKEKYVEMFHEQIREVLTNYGPVFEIWFDGANGGDGWYGGAKEKRTIPPDYYRFGEVVEMVRKLQPECVVWGAGDARWGGSESGHVGYPHWHTMDSKRGGSSENGFPHGDTWMPAEGDTSIRQGWFWHAREDNAVKSPEKLFQIWLDCVGRGANLILNLPPNRAGRLHANDISSLNGFRAMRDALLAEDFAKGARTSGPAAPQHPASALTDGDDESYWTVPEGTAEPVAEIALAKPARFDAIRLGEQIRLGQRVDSFAMDAWIGGAWKEIQSGKTIGYQVILSLSAPVETDRVRLRITKSTGTPCISRFSLLKKPVALSSPVVSRDTEGKIVIQSKSTEPLHYTTDGAEPSAGAPVYSGPLALPDGGTVKVRHFSGKQAGPVTSRDFGMPKTGWKIIAVTTGNAAAAIDDNPTTFWHTHSDGEKNPPQGFAVDLGRSVNITGFTYLPRQDGTAHGMTDKYRFELSRDGQKWVPVAEGEFSNIKANPVEQTIPLKKPVSARYFRFTGLHAVEKNHVSAAEIGVITGN
ncbi:MAG: alpha-L-fucosidase [Verrucomicrobiota bacterium]